MYDLTNYIEIFRDVLGLEQETDIRSADCEKTKEWDSYMHMELIAAIEERFQIKFNGEDVLKFLSFEDGWTILREKGVVCEGNS